MNSFVAAARAAVSAVSITGPAQYTWLEQMGPRLSAATRTALTPSLARSCLVTLLRHQLYADFYLRGEVVPSGRTSTSRASFGLAPFEASLSAANAGQGGWRDGWTIREVDGAAIMATDGAIAISASPGEYRLEDGASLVPGAPVRFAMPKEARRVSPGFYLAEGDRVPGPTDDLVRLYWHLIPTGAAVLMREITTRLNRAGIPFRFKVLNDPDAYDRCDAGVLYLRQTDYGAVAGLLPVIYAGVAAHLRALTPAFTKPLAPGLGLAEDPGGGESFGRHRCELLAEGLVRARENGCQAVEDRLAVVMGTFAEAGVALSRPYLRAGTRDVYEVLSTGSSRRAVRARRLLPVDAPSASACLATAQAIGNRLVRDAIWHEDRCTWMTADLVPQAGTARQVIAMQPLGPDLYSGASGVALFLAELAAQTGDPAIRATSFGAIRQALAKVEDIPPEARVGLYTGWLGVAWATVRAGELFHEPGLVAEGRNLLKRALAATWTPGMTDLLSGLAGGLLTALSFSSECEEGDLLAWARLAGDELLCAANRSATGISWPSLMRPPHPDLTGLSHGAAGIGLALLELFAATGEERYRDGALLAFAYERQWFDATIGNWADVRNAGRRTKPGSRQLPAMVAWCHGAPGIALSRARAWQVTGNEQLRLEANVALATTRAAVCSEIERGDGDATLCHGLLGNAEVLLLGAKMLDEPDQGALAWEAARSSIAIFGAGDRRWPCGGHAGEVPGLMLGLAGIGHFFLRLHDPEVPSVLMPDRPARAMSGARQTTTPALAIA